MTNIVILGAPGSGKGTYSNEIVKHFGYSHISTGDVLRSESESGSELGLTALEYMRQGQLIPDELMTGILTETYDKLGPECRGVIFDGYPRTIAQAESLKKMLSGRGERITAVLNLEVDETELMRRLLHRAQTEGRADDNEETIRKRFAVYGNQTRPLVEWFRNEGVLSDFVYKGSAGQMVDEIISVLESV